MESSGTSIPHPRRRQSWKMNDEHLIYKMFYVFLIILFLLNVIVGTIASTFVGDPVLFYTFPNGPECQTGRFSERTGKGPDFVMQPSGASCVSGGGVKVSSCGSPNEFAAFPLRAYEFMNGLSVEIWFQTSSVRLPTSFQANIFEISKHTVSAPLAIISNEETDVQMSSIFSAVNHAVSPMLTGAAHFPADGFCERADAIGTGNFQFAQQADSIRNPGVFIKLLFTYDNVSSIRTFLSTADGIIDVATGSTAYRIYSQNIFSLSYLRLGCSVMRGFGGEFVFHRVAVYDKPMDATKLWNTNPSPVVAWQVLPYGMSNWDGVYEDCGTMYRDKKRRRRILFGNETLDSSIPLYNNAKQLILPGVPYISGVDPGVEVFAWTSEGCGDPFLRYDFQNATVMDVSNTEVNKSVRCDEQHMRFCYVEAFPSDLTDGFVADFQGITRPTPVVSTNWQAVFSLVQGPGDAVRRLVQERIRWDGRFAYSTQFAEIPGSASIYNQARQFIGTMTQLLSGLSGSLDSNLGKRVWVPSATACDYWTSSSSSLQAFVWDASTLQQTQVGCDTTAYHLWFLEIVDGNDYFI